jgi:hypothetical protein
VAVLVGCGSTTPHPATTEVTNLGAEPRRLLRYEPRPNEPERFELTMKVRTLTKFTNTVLEEGEQAVDLPTVQVRGHMAANAASDISWELDEITILGDFVDPWLRAAMERELPKMKGWRATWHVAPNGEQTAFVVRHTPRYLPDLREALPSQFVFPDVPVGVGARWQETSTMKPTKIRWQRRTTYHLRALDENAATLDVHVEARAGSQAVSVEPKSTTRLNGGTLVGDFEVRVPFRGVVATSSGRSEGELNYAIVRGRTRITATVTTETLGSMKPCTVPDGC